KWRIAINFDDGMIQYQSPRNGQRVGFSVDLANVRSERRWRVIFDSTLNQTFVVAGDKYLGAVPFPAERVDDMMWTSYTSAQGGEAPTLSHYTVTRFDTAE
ncbi:MAG: hypothetical protein VYA30_16270, partial [Myxococcota bacterium]|nr:hypothetical protein [Myxococcota bacterium]